MRIPVDVVVMETSMIECVWLRRPLETIGSLDFPRYNIDSGHHHHYFKYYHYCSTILDATTDF
jgi:hypothetical protein